MTPMGQTIIVWALILLFLPRLKKSTAVTKGTWIFLILFSISVTLQMEAAYVALARWTGITHIGWLVSYIAGDVGLYMLYRALRAVDSIGGNGESAGDRLVYWATILLVIVLMLLFPQIATKPVGANEAEAADWGVLLFRTIPYAYSGIMLLMLSNMFFKYRNNSPLVHLKVRWVLLAIFNLFGALYFIIRLPYTIAVYAQPELATRSIGVGLMALLSVLSFARVSMVFFFIPSIVYRVLCAPFLFIDKVRALRQLEALLARIAALTPHREAAAEVNLSWLERQRNLDFLLYRSVISILDSKRRLNRVFIEDDAAPKLVQTLNMIHDDQDVGELIAAYRSAAQNFRRVPTEQGVSQWV